MSCSLSAVSFFGLCRDLCLAVSGFRLWVSAPRISQKRKASDEDDTCRPGIRFRKSTLFLCCFSPGSFHLIYVWPAFFHFCMLCVSVSQFARISNSRPHRATSIHYCLLLNAFLLTRISAQVEFDAIGQWSRRMARWRPEYHNAGMPEDQNARMWAARKRNVLGTTSERTLYSPILRSLLEFFACTTSHKVLFVT